MKKLLLSVTACLALIGCSAIPEPLQVTETTVLTDYSEALERGAAAQGEQARWGGVIAAVRNTENGTVIEVVNFPLQSWARPMVSDQSDGRFRAKIDQFVDPVVYKEGRSISFVGEIGAPEEGQIDDYTYLFPTLNVSDMYLWKEIKERPVQVDYSSLWYRHYYFTRPFVYPAPVVIPVGDRQGSDDNG
ncbi:Slp family lipoprotein [Pseudidiomarina taiwanensis]|uniref:Starvation-inducible protein n=1 Tax=Pseudidiomarina taiwanensis TaxID=337250 RepID=A0A432ZP12_9GAMM|nr:Slp family lipoprotein [Pseudidiomarina taiwanensis]RUO79576.1 starvation-inducible protein [Pseudidiomarina taiwanensis]